MCTKAKIIRQMNTLPDFFTSFFAKLPQPPEWLITEGHNRIVLLLNHVLQQDPEAMQRIGRQKGRIVKFGWQQYNLMLTATPVGLLALAAQSTDTPPKFDLLLEIIDADVALIGKKLMQGDKPNVRIEGDVQLAAEVQWLMQNVVWDIEGDLARVVGDVPAHHIAAAMAEVRRNLRSWVAAKS
jgi:ubiquinone biosynthesis protein UbiJ